MIARRSDPTLLLREKSLLSQKKVPVLALGNFTPIDCGSNGQTCAMGATRTKIPSSFPAIREFGVWETRSRQTPSTAT